MITELAALKRKDAVLMVVDIQERLFAVMKSKVQENLIKNTGNLIETCSVYNMPVIISEQYKKGLGETVKELNDKCDGYEHYEKTYFDCMADEGLLGAIEKTGKKTVILSGIESHICVFQTAVSLLDKGYGVIVASDAVGSRKKHNWQMAIAALRGAGAFILPTETICFAIMSQAGTPEFKKLAPLFK